MSVALGAQLGDEGDGVLVVVAVRVVQAAVPLTHHSHVLRVQAELAHTRVVHVLIVHPPATEDGETRVTVVTVVIEMIMVQADLTHTLVVHVLIVPPSSPPQTEDGETPFPL